MKKLVLRGYPSRILIIGDGKLCQESYKHVFEIEGFDVHVGGETIEVISEISQNFPDIILLDLSLKHIDGYELVKFIRKKLHSKTPIVAYGDSVSFRKIQKAIAWGANEYVEKQRVSAQKFFQKVHQLLVIAQRSVI